MTLAVHVQGTLIVRAPADPDVAGGPVGELVLAVAHRASLRLQLEPLATGYSRDVDGEVAIVPWNGPVRLLHMKATELGLRFTAPGLVRGLV